LARLEWLKQSDVGFGLPGMAWNVRSRFWLYWNGLSRISLYFRNVKNPHYTENMFSSGLNILLDCSGHSTVEKVCFFIMSGLKYHSL
jgi:hypothetical protein